MANQDAPFGFRQVGGLGSRPTSEGTSKYTIISGFTTAMYAGDVVAAGSEADEAGVTIPAGYVGQAAATSSLRIVGVFNGCLYDDPTTSKPTFKNYWPGDVGATATAFVYDNPDDLFEVQATGIIAVTNICQPMNFAYTAGSTINGRSKEELGITTSTTLQTRIVRISGDPSNSDAAAVNANWIVKFNKHLYYNYAK